MMNWSGKYISRRRLTPEKFWRTLKTEVKCREEERNRGSRKEQEGQDTDQVDPQFGLEEVFHTGPEKTGIMRKRLTKRQKENQRCQGNFPEYAVGQLQCFGCSFEERRANLESAS